VRTIEADRRAQISPDALFSLEELTLLNRYATPLERYLLLLGLNCAFTQAEIADLRVGEIFLHRPHHQEILAYAMEDSDSFVKRCRGKTGVYGEHILFLQTVEAMEWALAP